MPKFIKKKGIFSTTIFLVLFFLTFLPINGVFAEMTSSNYTLFADSINVGGGLGTSTSFILEDTLGEIGASTATSANFNLRDGYQSMSAEPVFTFSISGNSINLGALTDDAVSSASITVTTSASAPNGYTTSITEDGNLRSGGNDINDVGDGAVTAGAEEYGIRTSGSQGLFNNSDTNITSSAKNIASHSSFIDGSATTVTFKASRTDATVNGAYSHIVTFISTGNF